MASARKRPRGDEDKPEDKERAECPFSIRIVDPKDKEKKKLKRRRTDGGDDEEAAQRVLVQLSPFTPSGKFKTYETMDIHYAVEPSKTWTEMTRYNSFVLNGVKYFSEGFIYVANESTMERQQKGVAGKDQAPRKTEDDWVARILEIRASDEHHVYARVYWMYWPDELPPGTIDGKKSVQGRQPYHGKLELLASNHMDIINVVSVTSPATVSQWIEDNDDEVQNGLYWRQAFDVRTYELSGVDSICKCRNPENPDKTLIGCTSATCSIWMHEDCLKHDALMKTYERLGRDKPHRAPKREADEEKEAKRPLSPKEPGVADSAHHSIDVKQDGEEDAVHVGSHSEDVDMKQEDGEDKPSAGKLGYKTVDSSDKGTPTKRPGRPRKKPLETNGTSNSGKPYEGLFEATLRTDLKPPMLEFTDLRPNVGGEKTWLEAIDCLVCGARID